MKENDFQSIYFKENCNIENEKFLFNKKNSEEETGSQLKTPEETQGFHQQHSKNNGLLRNSLNKNGKGNSNNSIAIRNESDTEAAESKSNELPRSFDGYLKCLTQKDNIILFVRAITNIKKLFQDESEFYSMLSKAKPSQVLLIIDNLARNGKIIFKKKKYMHFLLKFYNSLYQESTIKTEDSNNLTNYTYTDLSQVLLERINIEDILSIKSHPLVILLFRELKCFRHREIFFSKLNNDHVWMLILENTYNYPLLEYLIEDLLNQKEFKGSNLGEPLFKLLEERFLEYCIGEFSTFVIQKYIQNHFSKKLFKLIKSNILNLILNKNGTYIVITTIKTLLSSSEENPEMKRLSNKLMRKILSYGEIICKDSYGSTLVEYVFETYKTQAIDYFLENKASHIYGKK